MKVAVALAAGVIIVAGFLAINDVGIVKAEFPEQCEDKDRENPNNRNSLCKFVGELTLERVEWIVYPGYPNCYDKFRLHVTGHEDMLSMPDARLILTWHDKKANNSSLISYYANSQDASGVRLGGHPSNPISLNYDDITKAYIDVVPIRRGHDRRTWDMNPNNNIMISSGTAIWNELDTRIDTEVFLSVNFHNPLSGHRYSFDSNPVPNALEFIGGIELVYGCIDLLFQEKEDREHATKVREQEVAALEEARLQAEAARLEEEQAKREAEAQARIDAEKLRAAQDGAIRTAETEKIKTQALLDRIEQEKLIADVLFEITRIRLRGAEERTKLTNEWLADRERKTAAFAQETADDAARIQQYVDFNKALLDSIARYQSEIDDRLAQTQRSVAEQQEAIDRMLQDAERSALESDGE